MAEIFYFYVQDDRRILFPKLEDIMQEDHKVATWRFRIPKILNEIDMSGYAWWFVYVNAKGQEFSPLLTLVDDPDEPDKFSIADYDIDYGISKFPGVFEFSLEAINADTGGEILNEWHTKTYNHRVTKTLQGNQAEFAETESDIISALIVEVQNKVNSLVGGATPPTSNTVAGFNAEESPIWVYTGSEDGYVSGNWYYYNGNTWQSGGQYASGVTIDPTGTQSGQAADAKEVGDRFADVFKTVNGLIETPGITNGTWANGGAVAGGNRGRTTSLIRCRGKISFGLGDYSKYKFGYMIYTSADLTQYTNSGWVTADVSNLDFYAYAIGFNFAHLSGSGAIPASELEEIHNLFSISVTGQMLTLRGEIETLQSEVATLKSAESAHENNLLPQIGANPFRFNPCYDHLFVNSKTDAVIPHESLYHVRLSKKFGFDVIEANVSPTSDGVYVVNHLDNYKFGNYFHHADGVTDISNILLSSVTWDWVVQNVRYNSTIAKYRTRPCRLEEFLQECRQQGLIPFITSSDTNVIAIADQYMGKDNYIAYGASRADCPNAIIYHWVSNLTTKEDILAYCENIGKPFIFGLGNVSDFTDASLKELVAELHENGYMIGIAYSDNNWHKYAAFGFDVNAAIRHINRIREGNLYNISSIFDFSDFEYTNATLSNGVLTFTSAGTIKPIVANTNYPLCGFDIEFDMIGTVTIPAVGEQKSSYNLTSDGSYPVFCVTPIINGSPAITINVASGTVIRDVFFKASVF